MVTFEDFCSCLAAPCSVCDGTNRFDHPTKMDDETGEFLETEEGECPACHGDYPRYVLDLDVAHSVFNALLKSGADLYAITQGCNCDPAQQTGGGHRGDCPAFQTECSCYESATGHQMGCAFYGRTVP
jgi:hypothetical protein